MKKPSPPSPRSPINPTVGRIVHYYMEGPREGIAAAQPLAACIAAVLPADKLCLAVFDPRGLRFADANYSPYPVPWHWTWPMLSKPEELPVLRLEDGTFVVSRDRLERIDVAIQRALRLLDNKG